LVSSSASQHRGDITVFYPLLSSMLGVIFALSGRLSDTLQLAALSLKYISTSPVGLPGQPSRSRLPGMHRWQSEVYRLAGQFDEALGICSRGLEMARQARQRADEASLLCALGNVAVDRQPPDVATAVPSYRNAADLAFELGMRPLIAHCHLGLGKLYLRTDKREQAQEHLTTATTMYREMGMTYWLEKAEAELK
jgi:tetratricopeptide (TPR) repeat protein